MNVLAEKFFDLRSRNEKAFIPFVTAGDPSFEASLEIVLMLAGNGADVVELGVPFSDPMADGPTIQASSQRALTSGAALPRIFELVRSVRERSSIPVVLFSYLNPIMRYGIEQFADAAQMAGANGVLITDVVDDEAAAIGSILGRHEIDLISLVAPTTTDARLKGICARSNGFIYAVSRAGVTGTQDRIDLAAEMLVGRCRRHTRLPIVVGFGISTADQVEEVWNYADGAVVGSAIVAEIERHRDSPDLLQKVENFVRGLLPQSRKRLNEKTK